MDMVSVRLIAADVKRLVAFYEQVSGLPATWHTDEFAELTTPSCRLAFGSQRTVALFGAGVARPADNHTAIIEFRVADVDREWDRVRPWVGEPVQAPTTMPWGNRSLLFRDPEGNLVNFFTPVTEAATARFGEASEPRRR